MSQATSFAALRNPVFRLFVIGNVCTMLADNMEHVVSYWVMFQRFHSPALSGFAVISHWLPALFLSIPVGALADRTDPRRLIQAGLVIFIGVSLTWSWLFTHGTLAVWHCMVLLSLHGMASVLWSAPAQVLLHDLVDAPSLQSAVRSNATARYLGTLLGPAVGSGLMLWVSPERALLINAAIYLPLFIWLMRAPYRRQIVQASQTKRAIRGFSDVMIGLRTVAGHPILLSMTLLGGLTSLLVGNAYQAQMPNFASLLGNGDPGIAYSVLLAADAAGALTAGFLLESVGAFAPSPTLALRLAAGWCVALGGFALSTHYGLSVLLLFVAGFMELAFAAMAQTLVQMHAPPEQRGRIIGVYLMMSLGLRTFSGVSIGLMGELLGVRSAMALSVSMVLAVVGMLYLRRPRTSS